MCKSCDVGCKALIQAVWYFHQYGEILSDLVMKLLYALLDDVVSCVGDSTCGLSVFGLQLFFWLCGWYDLVAMNFIWRCAKSGYGRILAPTRQGRGPICKHLK